MSRTWGLLFCSVLVCSAEQRTFFVMFLFCSDLSEHGPSCSCSVLTCFYNVLMQFSPYKCMFIGREYLVSIYQDLQVFINLKISKNGIRTAVLFCFWNVLMHHPLVLFCSCSDILFCCVLTQILVFCSCSSERNIGTSEQNAVLKLFCICFR